MKRAAFCRIFKIKFLIGLMGVVFFQAPALVFQAAAQDPSPTATQTPTPTASATPVGTPIGRSISFSPDDDPIKINSGQCVIFSWDVFGCVTNSEDPNFVNLPNYCVVEFEIEGDDNEPIRVRDEGAREECPSKDTEYQLTVIWPNDVDPKMTQQKEERDVEIRTSSGSSGGGNDGGGGGTVPSPGVFVVVTPILITRSLLLGPAPTATPVVGLSPSQPGGIFANIVELPETGFSAADSVADRVRDVSPRRPAATDSLHIMVGGGLPLRALVILFVGLFIGLLLRIKVPYR